MKQKKLILVKLIGIGNDENKRINNDNKNEDDSIEKEDYKYNNKDNDDGNSKDDDDDWKNRMYQCVSEASEYKGWVIKLVLTTPVKF